MAAAKVVLIVQHGEKEPLDALEEMRSPGAVVMAVSHGGVTVDALRTVLGDEALLARRPGLISDSVPKGAITELWWRSPNWEPKVIAGTGHLAMVTPNRRS